jgi:Domain of unknown function (DUF4190)
MEPRTQNKVSTSQFNELALLSLFLSVTFPPAALITGLIAKGQINKTGERGKSFAITGIVFGAVIIAFIVLLILISIASVNSYNNTYYSY